MSHRRAVREVRRAELVAAIGKPCVYCGEPMAVPTRDHIRPRSKGFTLANPANRAIVCEPCNRDKGSPSLASFAFRLRQAGDPRALFVEAFSRSLAALNPRYWPK